MCVEECIIFGQADRIQSHHLLQSLQHVKEQAKVCFYKYDHLCTVSIDRIGFRSNKVWLVLLNCPYFS